MSDEKDRHRENTPDDASDDNRDHAVARRDFIRKSAEVAAFSMFGVAGLDALVEGVIREVGRLTGDQRMASEAAEVLNEAGIGGVAHAQCKSCPTWQIDCENHMMYAPDCLMPSPPHGCNLYQPFVELPCGGQAGRWDCFDLTVPFVQDCTPPGTPFQDACTQSGKYHAECTEAEKTYDCPQEPFDCDPTGATVGFFDCSWWGQGKFRCGSGANDKGFDCNGGTLYDFRCGSTASDAFICGAAGGSARFDCDANHMFWCETGFLCQGSGFTCGAGSGGTNQCNTPETGVYDRPGHGDPGVPGDFQCEALGSDHFYCTGVNHFSCREVADDFSCSGTFICMPEVEPFNADVQCGPLEDGHGFYCKAPEEFMCVEGAFTCSAPNYYNA